jgi:hypothetical protein
MNNVTVTWLRGTIYIIIIIINIVTINSETHIVNAFDEHIPNDTCLTDQSVHG